MAPTRPHPFSANRLLAALPSKELDRWEQDFERVDLKPRMRLIAAGKPIEHAIFPESGAVALFQSLADGTTTEVGLTGNEGFAGVPLVLGARSSPLEARVQTEGSAWRLPAAIFVRACRERAFREPLLRYAQALHGQVLQTAVCNARHPLQERLARWLLEYHDRMGTQDLHLTHEILSVMLGTRRAEVTVALGTFAAAGLISTERSCVHILNRRGLEAAACECRERNAAEYRRLLP